MISSQVRLREGSRDSSSRSTIQNDDFRDFFISLLCLFETAACLSRGTRPELVDRSCRGAVSCKLLAVQRLVNHWHGSCNMDDLHSAGCRSNGVYEIPNFKHQITNKFQIPIPNDRNRFGIWNFWILQYSKIGRYSHLTLEQPIEDPAMRGRPRFRRL